MLFLASSNKPFLRLPVKPKQVNVFTQKTENKAELCFCSQGQIVLLQPLITFNRTRGWFTHYLLCNLYYSFTILISQTIRVMCFITQDSLLQTARFTKSLSQGVCYTKNISPQIQNFYLHLISFNRARLWFTNYSSICILA